MKLFPPTWRHHHLTIIPRRRSPMPLDGYHRAVRFWSKNDPAATLAVHVPVEA
jgi:hypothetical protein